MLYFLNIVFSMRKICLKYQLALFICCSQFNQGIFFYNYFPGSIFDILLRIQPEYHSFQRFSGFCVFLQKTQGNFLSLIGKFHCYIIHCYFLSLICNFKFFCFRVKHTVLTCLFFHYIVFSDRKIIQDCLSFFICYHTGYQGIFFIFYNAVSCFVFLSVRGINGFLCMNGKFCTFHIPFFIVKFITFLFFHDFFPGEETAYLIYKTCYTVFHLRQDLFFYFRSTRKFFSLFMDCKASYCFIIILFNDNNKFTGFLFYLVYSIRIYGNSDRRFLCPLVCASVCNFIQWNFLSVF